MSLATRLRIIPALLAILLVFLSGCTVQLAPSFSQTLLDGLVEANENTQVLLEGLEGGSSKSEFKEFSEQYIETVGKLKALGILADARATPPVSQRGIQWLQSKGVLLELCPDPSDCINPTPSVLNATFTRIQQMAGIHERAGVDSDTVESVQNFVSSQFELIIFFETALQR